MPFLVVIALAAAAESSGGAPGESPIDDPTAHTVLVWQGFSHFWERETVSGFHLPHRVSRFESWVAPGEHHATPAGVATASSFTFGQNTGVDGDYMFPEGYVARVYAPGVHVDTGVEHFGTIDEITDDPFPAAFVRLERVVDVPADGPAAPRTIAPILQGLSFRAHCVDEGPSCNSDGIWPFRFKLDLSPCEDRGHHYACPIVVEIGRAWTPGEANGSAVRRKPINPRMALDVDVHWAVLSGPSAELLAHPFTLENALASTRDVVMAEQVGSVKGLPPGYPKATVALHTLGFEFFPKGRARHLLYLGRYIGGWSLRVGVAGYDPVAGQLDVAHAGGIWLPRTVRQTGVRFAVGMTLLQFGGPGAEVVGGIVAKGALCANSHGAPPLTTWERCPELLPTGERTLDTVPLEIGPAP